MSALDEAIVFAVTHHQGQDDKAGEPYILHPIRVMLAGRDEDERIVGVLHDVVEDTWASISQVRKHFGDTVADAVDALTRRDGEAYGVYIERVATNGLASAVKVHDLLDNLSRISGLPEEEAASLTKRYRRALAVVDGPRRSWEAAWVYDDIDWWEPV